MSEPLVTVEKLAAVRELVRRADREVMAMRSYDVAPNRRAKREALALLRQADDLLEAMEA